MPDPSPNEDYNRYGNVCKKLKLASITINTYIYSILRSVCII